MVPQIAISLVERFTDVRFNWTTKTLQSFLEVVYWSSVTCETYSLYGDVHFSLEVCTFVGAMMSVCDEVVLQFNGKASTDGQEISLIKNLVFGYFAFVVKAELFSLWLPTRRAGLTLQSRFFEVSVSLSSGLDHLEDIDRNQIEKSEYGYWEEQVLDDPFMVLACRLVKIQHALKSFGHVVEMEAMDVYENLASK
ncbi:unnamed protein product [Peronospora belbahrii]|uniref:Uncharacterized protein n=1 Tax=Peronospora belbahrii TaxID=622444 RepID=A0AAU9L9S2_9STRA|nr:unnamed protein product [Peronospora belbahrii]